MGKQVRGGRQATRGVLGKHWSRASRTLERNHLRKRKFVRSLARRYIMSCFGCCGEYLDEDKKEKGTETGEVEPQVSEDVQIVFVLGGPGSGKGTQCDLIKEKYGFGHFSAGDLLRAEVESGSEVGKGLEVTMKEGKLVSSAVTIQLLKKAIANSDKKQILVDGFPRALDQAQEFEDKVIPCKLVLFFDCPQKMLQKRLMKRAKTSGRADDNAETIKKRFG